MQSSPASSTAPTAPKSTEAASTRARLIEAASRVCAARGLHGTTTREIAETAGVNEVTLFRHFGSKEKLLGAMFSERGEAQMEALSQAEPESADLAVDLGRYARRFNEMLFANEALIRAMIGEAHRQPEHARQVIYEAAKPLRGRVIAYLERAQGTGAVRPELDLHVAVDSLTGMLLAGMLRRSSIGSSLEYDHEAYIDGVIELFVRGVVVPGGGVPKKKRRG